MECKRNHTWSSVHFRPGKNCITRACINNNSNNAPTCSMHVSWPTADLTCRPTEANNCIHSAYLASSLLGREGADYRRLPHRSTFFFFLSLSSCLKFFPLKKKTENDSTFFRFLDYLIKFLVSKHGGHFSPAVIVGR